MKPKVDYESFMSSKQAPPPPQEEEDYQVDDEFSSPLPPPPPKAKSTMGLPIFVGLIVFLLLIGSIAVYFGISQNNTQTSVASSETPAAPKGDLKVIHTDKEYTVYDAPSAAWLPKSDKTVPFGTMLMTGNDSRRNIFTVNGVHSIRTDKDTKFKLEALVPSTDFKEKVKLTVIEGDLWVEGVSDVFEASIPTGLIVSDGKDFEIKIKDGATTVYAWKGNIVYTPMESGAKKVDVKEGKMLYIDAKGDIIPPPPGLLAIEEKKTDWQQWNLSIKAADLNGEKPEVAQIPTEVNNEEKILDTLKASELSTPTEKETPKTKPAVQTAAKPQPKPQEKPDIPKIGGDPKYPTKGTYGKKQETENAGLPKPNAPGGRPVMEGQVPNQAQAPQPNNNMSAPPQPPTMPVHSGGNTQSSGSSSSYSSGSDSSSTGIKTKTNPLDNSSREASRNVPPGFKLNEAPVGPGQQ